MTTNTSRIADDGTPLIDEIDKETIVHSVERDGDSAEDVIWIKKIHQATKGEIHQSVPADETSRKSSRGYQSRSRSRINTDSQDGIKDETSNVPPIPSPIREAQGVDDDYVAPLRTSAAHESK